MIDYSFSLYDLEYFLLIFTRISCFVFIAPFFGMANTPRRIKVVLSLYVATLMYFVLTPAPAVLPKTVLGFAIIVTKEAVTGLLIGLSAQMCTSIVMFGGAVADMEIGLSMVQLMDPATRQSTTFTGALYNYALTMALIASGMYRYLLGALADSYKLIPVNGAVFNPEKLLQSSIVFLTDYMSIGFRIILPVFCAILLLNAVLGIMARVAPQMNMFAIGIQLKILVGLSMLFVSTLLLPKISEIIFDEIRKTMVSFVEAMY